MEFVGRRPKTLLMVATTIHRVARFHIVKLGFTGEYIIFLISAQNIDETVLTSTQRTASATVLTSTHNVCLSRNMKNIRIFR